MVRPPEVGFGFIGPSVKISPEIWGKIFKYFDLQTFRELRLVSIHCYKLVGSLNCIDCTKPEKIFEIKKITPKAYSLT